MAVPEWPVKMSGGFSAKYGSTKSLLLSVFMYNIRKHMLKKGINAYEEKEFVKESFCYTIK